MLTCVYSKYDTTTFYMTLDHFPTKNEIFDKFRYNHDGTPIMLCSCCELPDEHIYNDFRW